MFHHSHVLEDDVRHRRRQLTRRNAVEQDRKAAAAEFEVGPRQRVDRAAVVVCTEHERGREWMSQQTQQRALRTPCEAVAPLAAPLVPVVPCALLAAFRAQRERRVLRQSDATDCLLDRIEIVRRARVGGAEHGDEPTFECLWRCNGVK